MKKPMTLAEQVRDAQRVVSSWSPQKREMVRLEGSDLNHDRLKSREQHSAALRAPKKA